MWKVAQSKKRKKEKVKLAVLVLGLIVLLIIISQIVRFTNTLFSPWNISSKSEQHFSWNKQFNINLLIKDKSISLLSYSPKTEQVFIVRIPEETYLDVPHGFGKWQLRSIYDLGESGVIGGNKLLEDSLTNFFGLPIDGFLQTDSLEDFLNKNPMSIFGMLHSLSSDLTLWDLMQLKMSLSGVRFDKINQINLADLNVMDKTKLLDGSEVFVADTTQLDTALSDLHDSTFVSEGVEVAIFNATDHPQLAQKATRLITNLGGRVIIMSNSEEKLDKTVITGEKSATLTRLKQIFGSDGKINPKDGSTGSPFKEDIKTRAQINLFLGEDFYK